MEELFIPFLIIHIVMGALSLMTGTLNILFKKGTTQHKTVGKVFVISMLISSFTALILSIYDDNLFLLIIGIFTIYMIATGTRFLKIKKRVQFKRLKYSDWVLTLLMLFFSIFLLTNGIQKILNGFQFGIVPIVFSLISLFMVIQDIRIFMGLSRFKNFGLLIHIQRMIGAYIASLTAFLVVNVEFSTAFVVWLLPTLIFLPLIIIWSRKMRVRI
jgi:uncharacterized membrane protein